MPSNFLNGHLRLGFLKGRFLGQRKEAFMASIRRENNVHAKWISRQTDAHTSGDWHKKADAHECMGGQTTYVHQGPEPKRRV